MDIIESGYRYRVYDLKKENPQDITFTRRNSEGEFEPGTTNEEIVDVLIARMYALNSSFPTSENQCVIILLKAVRQIFGKMITKKQKRKNDKKDFNGTKRGESGVQVYEHSE